MGELGALKAHLDAGAKGGCDYVLVHKCPNGCAAVPIMRKDLRSHLVSCDHFSVNIVDLRIRIVPLLELENQQ